MAPDSPSSDQARLITALRTQSVFGGGCEHASFLQTHISCVLLTGKHAYKIRKCVSMGFLDFTTLSARRFYCKEELRLNRRLAPALHPDVVAITGTVDAPILGGDGPALEYAVKMREFPQESLASWLLSHGEFGAADIDALAAKVVAFHAKLDVAAPASSFGRPDDVLRFALQNFSQVRPLLRTPGELADLEALALWAEREHKAHYTAFCDRQRGGFIRACHGDLHLGNIARIDGEVTIFDCIAFDDAMRWIDIMSEVAFTAMDLQDCGRSDLGHRFLNAYLEITGDYAGLSVLHFYLAYRAMVRGRIARLRAAKLGAGDASRAALDGFHGYVHLALSYARPPRPAIILTHGKLIRPRAMEGLDASDADLAVLDHQLQVQDPLTPEERADVIVYNSEAPLERAYAAASQWPDVERVVPSTVP